MKKFLSLVLALVMTMSLVTVSAGAKDFTDSGELSGEQYAEAVNVMSEMGIIDGYAGGDFRPQGTLTRGAAAKIIACMMLGKRPRLRPWAPRPRPLRTCPWVPPLPATSPTAWSPA